MDKILTNYIAAWGWQLMSWMFLCTMIILIALQRTNVTITYAIVFFFLFAGAQYMSHKRKKEVYNEPEE